VPIFCRASVEWYWY